MLNVLETINGAIQGADIDLSDYAKLAISTTQANLYDNLIANSLLIPNQWYLVTDYKNETLIANSSVYRSGLCQNLAGNATYPDGSLIVDGDGEAIYLRAFSANQLESVGYSKTFPDEIISFQQTVPDYVESGSTANGTLNALSYASANTCVLGGSSVNFFELSTNRSLFFSWNNSKYAYAYGDDAGWVYNDGDIVIEPDTTYTLSFANGTPITLADIPNFYMEYYDGVYDTYYYFDPSTYGTEWSFDFDNQIFTDLTESQDFSNITSSSSYVYLEISTGDSLTLNELNYGTLWTFDAPTNTITTTSIYDFTLTQSFDGSFSAVVNTFQGRITGRRNDTINLEVQADYRSQLFRRFKPSVSAYVSGSYADNSVVSYNGNIYKSLRATTSSYPPSYESHWFLICQNSNQLASAISVNGVTVNTDSASYTDYPMFNTMQMGSAKINVKVIRKDKDTDVDLVFSNGNVSASTNSVISGTKSTIFNYVVSSNLVLSSSYVSTVTNCSYINLSGCVSYQGVISKSNIYEGINTLFYGVDLSNIKYIVTSAVRTITKSEIVYANTWISAIQFSQSTMYFIAQSKFFGAGSGNICASITTCEFLSTFNGNVISGSLGTTKCDDSFSNNFIGGAMSYYYGAAFTYNKVFSNFAGANKTNNVSNYATMERANFTFTSNTFNGAVNGILGVGRASITNNTFNGAITSLTLTNAVVRIILNTFGGISSSELGTTGRVDIEGSYIQLLQNTTIPVGGFTSCNIFKPISGVFTFASVGYSQETWVGDASNYTQAKAGVVKYVGGSTEIKRYVAATANYGLAAGDYLCDCTSGTFTVNLPTAIGIEGKVYVIKNSGAGTITVDANTTQTIDGSLTQSVYPMEKITIMSNGANWIII
jgi:hypothetical protein